MRFGSVKGALGKHASRPAPPSQLTRYSSGFEQFCSMLQSSQNLSILDMSGASQANISFITDFGHRISSDDVVGTMQQYLGNDFLANQQAASTAHRFLEQVLNFPDASFDGALVWDTLQFLTSPVLDEVIAKLFRVLRPGALLLLFFNADEKAGEIPVYNYRIQDYRTLLQIPRGGYQKVEYFNNRMLERLFHSAASLKFFLTRGNLRELIVRR
jgi:SAM-dependent methyltransferase